MDDCVPGVQNVHSSISEGKRATATTTAIAVDQATAPAEIRRSSPYAWVTIIVLMPHGIAASSR